jgi:hypothetical protein
VLNTLAIDTYTTHKQNSKRCENESGTTKEAKTQHPILRIK